MDARKWAFSEAKLLYAERGNSPNPLTMPEALRAVHESAFFDKSLLGSASPLMDRTPGKHGVSILSRTKLGAVSKE